MTDFTLNQYLILLSRTLQGTQLGANLGTAVTLLISTVLLGTAQPRESLAHQKSLFDSILIHYRII